MNRFIVALLMTLPVSGLAQDGKIVEKHPYQIADSVRAMIRRIAPPVGQAIETVNFYHITYLSDGLKVKGFLAEPKKPGKYPCIIANRGGNRDFGKWEDFGIGMNLGNVASWGYVVVASQYRGNGGGEGREEFGGKDINDVLNLLPCLSQIPQADTTRVGIMGGSRGGMMTYLSLKQTCRFKAAVVFSGAADLVSSIAARPEMETRVYAELMPEYTKNKQALLKERSAVYWADEMCKTTPLLIMHGSADWRVSPTEAFTVVEKLYEAKHPVRFILYEGADHSLTEHIVEAMEQTRNHFNRYLRDGAPLPDLKPHGR